MPDLVRLVYVSRPARPLAEPEMDALLASARAFNARRAVTGSLLVLTEAQGGPGAYVQWLEGPEGSVAAAFRRIVRDGRHTDVRVLARSAVPLRAYADWTMRHQVLPGESIQTALARFGIATDA